MKRCLYCYGELGAELDFHAACSKKIFGTEQQPELPYSEADLEPLAQEILQTQTTVTGVQSKLSLHISDSRSDHQKKRFTIVGLWGGYILKPPTPHYRQLPEVEDLTMHLAELAKIETVPHCLIRLASGNLAYITKRIDRTKKGKLAMEDMCQLTERLTEHKYHGSYEQVGKAILKYSATPGLDIQNFMELVLFSFLTGNADMHLKNFSLLEKPGLGLVLSPAYDLLNTALVNPADDEDLALTLNGKKKKINRKDFTSAMANLKMDEKQQTNLFGKMAKAYEKWLPWIDLGFLSDEFKQGYKEILNERMNRLGLI